MSEKMWGSEPFWGLGYEWDPDWVYTDRQKELRATLIELCEKELRANAKRFDDELMFPRRNLELLGEHGFLGLTVPEEYGGLGEDHVAYSMVCETIARYGCASTAMCYVMHIGAVNAIMLRETPELVDKYLRPAQLRQDRHALPTRTPRPARTSGTRSPPAPSGQDGGSRSARRRRGRRRRGSPTSTSSRRPARISPATTTSPCSWSTASRCSPSRRSGTPSACGATNPGRSRCERRDPRGPARRADRRRRELQRRIRRPLVPVRLVLVWNGLALGAIDIAKRHTTRKKHVDVGLRVADYPTIQDYVGEAVMDTNASRLFVLSVAQAMDGDQ